MYYFGFLKTFLTSKFIFMRVDVYDYCLSLIHILEILLQEMPNLTSWGLFQIMDLVSSVMNELRKEKR